MKRLKIVRVKSDNEGTLGTLFFEGNKICMIGEPPWRKNIANKSCIPTGTYTVNYLPKSASGKYRDVYHLQNVPNRSGVLIHCGNFMGNSDLGFKTHSLACLLPGLRAGRLQGQRAVLASRSALKKIHSIVKRKTFLLEIKNA